MNAMDFTPKKRKNLTLANLHSTLSEKYIGFTPPSTSSSSPETMITRQSRGRLSNNGGTNYLDILSPSSQTTPPRRPLTKNYVSPIDKLLLKNGSTSITPIHDNSPKEIRLDDSQSKSGSMKSFLAMDCVDLESLIPFNKIEDDRDKHKWNKIDSTKRNKCFLDEYEMHATNIDVHEDIGRMAKDVSAQALSKEDAVVHGDYECMSSSKYIHANSESNLEKKEGAVEIRMLSQDDSLEFDVDVGSIEEVENGLLTIDSSNKEVPINVKSPSAVSLDSAKGSSLANETAWMSYTVGDLYWGQIFTYCYWPCIVCPDPEDRIVITEENNRNGELHVLVHVRFFADNGRRNWVKSENLLPYNGLPNYQEYVNEVRVKYGNKSLKYKLLKPKPNKKATWHKAINEANSLVSIIHSDRVEKFFDIYEHTKSMQQMGTRLSKAKVYMPYDVTSDFGSQCDSLESLSLTQAETNTIKKRERSSSPCSPAYSPVKVKLEDSKRRKLTLENNDDDDFDMNSGEVQLLNMDTQDGEEFKRFYAVMRDYTMADNTDSELEQSFAKIVHNIWELRCLTQKRGVPLTFENYKEQKLGSNLGVVHNDGKIKRLSSRLRSMIIKRENLPSTSVLPPTTSQPAAVAKEKPNNRLIKRPMEIVIDDIFNLDRKYLFKGHGREPICKYCYQSGDLLQQCDNGCQSWLHPSCAVQQLNKSVNKKRNNRNKKKPSETSLSIEPVEELGSSDLAVNSVTCVECKHGEEPGCRVCQKTEITGEELISCKMQNCFNKFHPGCCRYWPQAKFTKSQHRIENFRCPSHVCHTCVSDDPKGKFQHLSNAKLTKCVRCPATFHTDSTCIPAGTQILNSAYIICPRHSDKKTNVAANVNWCFICVGGGQLMCCDTCPIAVHAQCLKIPIAPHEAYVCEECESGRMPLYGEMVWAKFNVYRWWPAIILPPPEVPQNIMRKPHGSSEFVVRFFGTHDHGWIARNRVYIYLEGDSFTEPPRSKSSMDLHYNRGIEEAKRIYELIKTFKLKQRQNNENKEKLYPQPYTRIKTNRSVPPVKLHSDLNKVNVCDCRSDSMNPCGIDTDCLNRVLYHECNPKLCPAGERCQNQMFESRISPRLEVVYKGERGFGLMCCESIAAGSFIIEYVGEVINHEEFQRRLAQKSIDRDENYYFFTVEKDYIIDAGPKGNLARFMNHSCEPNCETQKWLVNGLNRVGLFALQNIPANTELTFNYNWDELLGNEKMKTCYCGAAKCAGEIGGKYRTKKVKDDVQTIHKEKGTRKKITKPLKRLQKQSWKIIPQSSKKLSKVNTKHKFKHTESNTSKRKKQMAIAEDPMNSTKEKHAH